MCAPLLTTVGMPMEAAGRAAVELLLARQAYCDDRVTSATHSQLGTRLILRATTGPPPKLPLRTCRSYGRSKDRYPARVAFSVPHALLSVAPVGSSTSTAMVLLKLLPSPERVMVRVTLFAPAKLPSGL